MHHNSSAVILIMSRIHLLNVDTFLIIDLKKYVNNLKLIFNYFYGYTIFYYLRMVLLVLGFIRKYIFLQWLDECIWASDEFVSRDFQLNEISFILHIFTYFTIIFFSYIGIYLNYYFNIRIIIYSIYLLIYKFVSLNQCKFSKIHNV